uniref:Cytochrome c oxidase subunit 2 n=1 Tax=Paulinella micropora TaxID=1928728 RepID=A0A385I1A7_9EUKA|nr:putative cytochrome c oxidase subunit II [Paulinella micropora]AXY63655.1 putative cytochrome c oxidase subunit II [Paulinella micropora]
MSIRSITVAALISIILILAGLWVGQNVNLLPVAASANAPLYDQLFRVLLSVSTVLFLTIFSILIFSLIRFRRQMFESDDGLSLQNNLGLEILWTAIPAVIILVIGLYSYDIYDQMGGMVPLKKADNIYQSRKQAAIKGLETEQTVLVEGDKKPQDQKVWGGIGLGTISTENHTVPIEVTAMQFAFIFKYPSQNIVTGELHVPVGRPVELRMEAKDVIHAFWVPEFRLKQDIIPGQPTLLSFTPTRTGTYPIVCAELCGPYHGGMRSQVIVDEPDVFDEWLVTNTPLTVAANSNLFIG